ncbi:hypothetical protein C8R47DRAFT_1328367 [Mycena vitilis]|nr:hypothetical protein C8R47DRAFT_1328367 [Mycena vitilis]
MSSAKPDSTPAYIHTESDAILATHVSSLASRFGATNPPYTLGHFLTDTNRISNGHGRGFRRISGPQIPGVKVGSISRRHAVRTPSTRLSSCSSPSSTLPSNISVGFGYTHTKPAPSFKRTVDVKSDEISLPAYSPSAGTGSFTAGELKRAPSSASSFGTSSFSTSPYAGMRFPPTRRTRTATRARARKDVIDVSSVYSAAGYWSADGHGHAYDDTYSPAPASSTSTPSRSASSSHPAHSSVSSSAPHAHAALELDPDSPLSATCSSFTHTVSSFARTSTGSALPPHIAWEEDAYPASPRSVAHPNGEEAEGKGGGKGKSGRRQERGRLRCRRGHGRLYGDEDVRDAVYLADADVLLHHAHLSTRLPAVSSPSTPAASNTFREASARRPSSRPHAPRRPASHYAHAHPPTHSHLSFDASRWTTYNHNPYDTITSLFLPYDHPTSFPHGQPNVNVLLSTSACR